MFVIIGQIQYHLSHDKFDKTSGKVSNHSVRNFFRPTAMAVIVMIVIAIAGTYLPLIYKSFYGKLYVIENGKETEVMYMNDKYIICG